ncbi:hypothetical protein BJX64DRAFT_239629 [Aspergillus heterothallicus]
MSVFVSFFTCSHLLISLLNLYPLHTATSYVPLPLRAIAIIHQHLLLSLASRFLLSAFHHHCFSDQRQTCDSLLNVSFCLLFPSIMSSFPGLLARSYRAWNMQGRSRHHNIFGRACLLHDSIPPRFGILLSSLLHHVDNLSNCQ